MNRANTLVATLLTVVIILVLMVAIFKGSSMFGGTKATARPDGKGTTVLGQARYAAKDEVCRSNLQQVRDAIQVYETTNDDKPPAQLSDTKIGSDFYSCPLGHEPYAYDPATGVVHCVHPGHEGY